MRKARPLIIMFLILGLPILIVYLLSLGTHHRKTLEIISPKIANPGGSPDSVYQTIPPFVLTDQRGEQFRYPQDVEGKILVVGTFFTECGNKCNKTSMAMERIHDYPFPLDSPLVEILYLTVDPETDTPEKLAEYANRYEAEDDKWHFLTGDSEELFTLIKQSFLMDVDSVMRPVSVDNSLLIVDPEGRLRGKGLYNGTTDADVNSMMKHLKLLQFEYAAPQ